MTPLILSVFIAVSVSGLCSFMEAALYSLPWSHIESLRKAGKKSGNTLFRLRSSIEQPITAVLTLNTVANTAGASVAGSYAAAVFSDQNTALFAAAFTLIILFVSEIIPKTLGVAYCRQASTFLAYTVDTLVLVLKPFIAFSSALTRLVTPRKQAPPATEEDIHALISILGRNGLLEQYEAASIRNILSLNDKAVRDIMTPRTVVFSLPAEITVREAHDLQHFWHFSRIPVYNENSEDIIGLVSRRRILEELAQDRHERPIAELTRPVHFVLESMPLNKALLRFLDDRVQLFVVLDEFGGMAGLVTLEDVLEEILGREIVDETDEVPDLRELAKERRRRLIPGQTGQNPE